LQDEIKSFFSFFDIFGVESVEVFEDGKHLILAPEDIRPVSISFFSSAASSPLPMFRTDFSMQEILVTSRIFTIGEKKKWRFNMDTRSDAG